MINKAGSIEEPDSRLDRDRRRTHLRRRGGSGGGAIGLGLGFCVERRRGRRLLLPTLVDPATRPLDDPSPLAIGPLGACPCPLQLHQLRVRRRLPPPQLPRRRPRRPPPPVQGVAVCLLEDVNVSAKPSGCECLLD